jgi:putative endonuclease
VNRRAATHDAGRGGENLAAWALRLKGYRILARNFRAGPGEVDIVARAPGFGPIPVLAFVEVKFRPDTAAAAEAISADKRRRVIRAAEGFVAARPRYANAVLRFDAMLVAPGSWPRHVPDAWQA